MRPRLQKIDTGVYARLHQRLPSKINALWAFRIGVREVWFTAPYEEACKLARKTAQERKFNDTIILLP